MSFLHSAFINKNTPELRRYLKNLGYENGFTLIIPGKNIATFKVGFYTYNADNELKETSIDCTDNEDLFRAIVAIRDDANIFQWFKSNRGNKMNIFIPKKMRLIIYVKF